MLKAKNMVMDKEGILESRRGLKQYGNVLTLAAGEKINAFFNYKNTLLVHYASKIAYDSNGAGTWTDYSGSYTAPSGAVVIRGLEANRNFYMATNAGVKKLDSVTGAIGSAGGIKALDGSAALSGAGAGFFSVGNQLAYRIVWGITDANSNLILGSPSQRFIVTNPALGTADTVTVTFTIPSGVTTSHFYQIYRSVLSGGASTVPNDELALVYENNPTAPQIAAGTITVTDATPENLRGATIYTAPSQQGIAAANEPPPLCRDMAFYKNSVLFANTVSKNRMYLTMVSVGGAIGIALNDTITIGGIVYTAKNAEVAAAGQFLLTTGGTPAANIDATAQSLVRVINQYSSSTVYAYYLSGYTDLPGKILLEERSIGGSAFVAISSNGAAYDPILPTSGTTISSTNDTAKNKIFVSKSQQPEAVPIANFITVGSADKNIVRVIALRDSVFVFKEDGIFRITGESLSNYQVSLFDVTVVLAAAETAVPFNNQIYAYTSQGVVAVSDTGSSIMSRPIEIDLLPIATYTNFSSIAFGIAYNSDRKYLLFVQTISTDTTPQQSFIYNAISNAWTLWSMGRGCGIVNSADDRLYLGDASSGKVYRERKDFTTSDYSDDELAVTITGSSGTTVHLASTTGVTKNWTLYQNGRLSKITAIVNSTDITVLNTIVWQQAAATVLNPISVELETIQQTAQNPGILKQFRDITIFFRKAVFKSLDLGIKSNISAYLETTPLSPTSGVGFGAVPWGQLGWGGSNVEFQTIRTLIPRNKQRCHWLQVNIRHSLAREYFAVAGISLQYDPMSERTR